MGDFLDFLGFAGAVFAFLFIIACLVLKIPGVLPFIMAVFDAIESGFLWLLPEISK